MKNLIWTICALLLSVNTHAATHSGTCGNPNVNNGKNVKWTLTDSTLTISGSGAMLDYDYLGGAGSYSEIFGWTNYTSQIKTVIIKNGVTSVGACAFVSCNNLTSVTLASSVKKIGDNAFNGCIALTSVEIPSACTTIGSFAFQRTRITEITFPATITSIGTYAFLNTNLTKVTCLANTPPSLGSLPFGYSKIVRLYVNSPEVYKDSDWNDCFVSIMKIGDTADAKGSCGNNLEWTLIGEMLTISGTGKMDNYGTCGYDITNTPWHDFKNNITSIHIESGVTHIGNYAFRDCRYIDVIICDAPTPPTLGINAFYSYLNASLYVYDKIKYKTSDWNRFDFNIQQIGSGDIAGDCGPNLKWVISNDVLTISGTGKMDNYETYYQKAPWEDESFSSVVIENGVTSIGTDAFYGNTSLTSISIPSTVTLIDDYAFYGCSSLLSIDIPESVLDFGNSIFNGCTGLKSAIIASPSTGYSMFSGCTNLASVTLTSTVTEITSYTFENCTSLTSITIPESVLDFGYSIFDGCTGLKSAIIASPSTGYSMFSGCTNLASVTLASTVTKIASSTFENCTSLTSITIPNSVTEIGYTSPFEGCINLASIVVEERNTIYDSRNNCNAIIETSSNELIVGCFNSTIPEGIEKIGSSAFSGCSKLNTITIPASVTNIYSEAFKGCTGLKEIKIEDSPKILSLSYNSYNTNDIGKGLFYDCPLETVYLGRNLDCNFYSTPEECGYSPFYNIKSLCSLTIGSNVTNIPTYTFMSCENLATISCYSIVPPTCHTDALSGINKNQCILHIPSGYTSVYKTAEVWKDFITIKDDVQIKKYALKFLIDGEIFKSDSLAFGEKIVVPEVEEKEGYTFSGWKNVPETMPAEDVTIHAYSSVNTYAVIYFLGRKVIHEDYVAYGDTIPEYIYEPNEGWVFEGWEGEVYITMPAHNVKYKAIIRSDLEQTLINQGEYDIYDLYGRRIEDSENLPSGLYIVNGQKVMIQ